MLTPEQEAARRYPCGADPRTEDEIEAYHIACAKRQGFIEGYSYCNQNHGERVHREGGHPWRRGQ